MSVYHMDLSCTAKDHAQAKEIVRALAIISLGINSDYLDVEDEGVGVRMEGDFDDKYSEDRAALVSVIARYPEAKFMVSFDDMDDPMNFWKEEYQDGHFRTLKGVRDYATSQDWTPVWYRAVKDYVGERPAAHFRKGDYCSVCRMTDERVDVCIVGRLPLQLGRLAFDEYFEALPQPFGGISIA